MKRPNGKKQRRDASYKAFRFWFSLCMFVILSVSLALFSSATVVVENTDLIPGLNEDNWLPFIFSALASLIVGTLLTPLVLRIPLKPIDRLISGMRRLANGHFDERIDLGDLTMLQNLSESFNAMATELQNTELLRTDFVNNFSHEFKTPIVSIRGFAKLLQRENLPEEKRREYVDIIVDEAERLSNMATNVLTLTRVENQTILTDAEEYNLSEQIRKCILLLEKKWSEKQLIIDADFGEHSVTANRELMKQVWVNLLDNAVKFSPAGGTVHVRVAQDNDDGRKNRRILVDVINHGPEIPPEQHERIFEKFYQGDQSHAAEGTGVGLPMARRIVALHGGEIRLDSTPSQTTFSVALPLEYKK